MNRLPKVKGWINDEAPAYLPDVTVDYVGGDPRFIFYTTSTEVCVDASGKILDKLESNVEASEEIKINEFDADKINSLL